MEQNPLNKYSQISTIVIATILIIGFLWFAYSQVWTPYQTRLSQERENKAFTEAATKRQENKASLDKCYADASAASQQRKTVNCTTKADDSAYFYCSAEFITSNNEIERVDRSNCEIKYPLN